uniref:Uncharacterized protein n=1 Tax=Chromera velia CCMP2878 TaxID=1169474 RepID=A0A0G4FBQ4_9ALVE|eukprot:Cvel_16071.t1-p1 / transcript=Cvel_16071.t1 / gene=Cvel_16071 / organism=Chromera_velia_CCMP2878 / gene_product=hypothetical protein / transcript_product=hypothetical protein / location=Cvel_scaffold1221:46391-47515(+) / protein_length=375 / sequence_SO=supercontig / SO=protein_coding / is_pseudo=false
MLSELSFPDMKVSNEDLVLLAEGVRVGNLGSLRLLDLGKNWRIGKEGMDAVMQAVLENEAGLPLLEKLLLPRTNAGRGAASLCTALRSGRLPRLSEIDLEGTGLNLSAVKALADTVRGGHLSRVSSLRICGNVFVFADAWSEFIEGITEAEGPGLPFLKSLDFSGTKAGGGLVGLGAALVSGRLDAVTEVKLRNSSLTDSTVRGLADALREGQLRCLTLLDLSFNERVAGETWAEFLRAMAETHNSLPKMKSLNLSKTKVGEGAVSVGCVALFRKVQRSCIIDLQCTGLADESVIRLGESLRGVFASSGTLKLAKDVDFGWNANHLVKGGAQIVEGPPGVTDIFIASPNNTDDRALVNVEEAVDELWAGLLGSTW